MKKATSVMDKLDSIEQLLNRQSLQQQQVLSLEDACTYLNVSASYLYKLTSKKQVPHYVPTGKKIYFKRIELEAWLLSNRQGTDAEMQQQATDFMISKQRRA